MTQYLALDWESHRLSGICANVDGGQILSQSCFQLDWPANLAEDADGTQTGQWLREELDRLGIAVSQVLVCLPREDSVVRQLELPAVPDKELPDIVRLQAATNLTSLDQFLLDFLPLPTLPEADGRDVLMATIPIELANRIRTATAAAGLELKSIGLSPVATAELVARAEAGRGDDPRQSSLFVALHGERVEISMMRQQCLIFSHSAQLSGTDAADYSRLLLAEINRARYSQERLLQGAPITRAWVIGSESETAALAGLLAQRLDAEALSLDPLSAIVSDSSAPEQHSGLAGVVGMLLQKQRPIVQAVDFINPREPIVEKDTTRLKIAVAAAAVILLCLSGYAMFANRLSTLESQTTIANEQAYEFEQDVKQGQPRQDINAVVTEWDRSSTNWLDQMDRLNQILPGTDRMYLTQYKFSPGKKDKRASVSAFGYAKTRREVEDIKNHMDRYGYEVAPKEIEPRRDPKYPTVLDLEMSLPFNVSESDEKTSDENRSESDSTNGEPAEKKVSPGNSE